MKFELIVPNRLIIGCFAYALQVVYKEPESVCPKYGQLDLRILFILFSYNTV